MKNKVFAIIGAVIIGLTLSFAIGFYKAFAIVTVYNHIVPGITGWAQLTYWQAYGIGLLFDLFFVGITVALSEIHSDVKEEGGGIHINLIPIVTEALAISITLLIFVIFKGLM